MEKLYQPEAIERHWRLHWEEQGYFKPSGEGASYCIVLPPPNVTGTLHMGHGFQHTLMDALIRRARMQGKNTLWQPGTDHAGIATQMVVERQLAQQGQSRHDLGRAAFIEKVWQWREESGSTITSQMRRLGTSTDWTREQFSMNPQLSKATYQAFIQLFDEGLIYRGQRLVNWDPVLHTAISDLEVDNQTKAGHLWHIRYPLTNGEGYLTVATTRPETLLGDVAVAVHPEDPRYQHLIGQTLALPLCHRNIPIIADTYVDAAFGSGCVKITPAHDFNDYEVGKRHGLPLLNIFTEDAVMNDTVPLPYQGLDRFVAREKILQDLTAADLLDHVDPHTLNIPYGDRSGAVIEPWLTDQWYVKAAVLAKPAIQAVETGALKFIPENWNKTYLQWLENIQDWCISRQLWWGHRIPIWYDENGQAYAGMDEQDARKRHQLPDNVVLTQDEDVLDTWFTSALWPFASLGWPENLENVAKYYPTQVLVTGFDIIFFWVARMVMMGLHFMKAVPFQEVLITGLVRDNHGHKMSKSKGNILDPIDLIDGIDLESLVEKRCKGLMQPQQIKTIEKQTRQDFKEGIAAFGTDALRFTFAALATMGRDVNFDQGRIGGYRNFCNKLWNAARYVIGMCEDFKPNSVSPHFNLADRFIRHQLQILIKAVNTAFDQYRFDLVTQLLYEFTWNDYCDWYLELSKTTLNNAAATPEEKQGTCLTLLLVLENLLRLLHPIMPFITEEIWQKIAAMLKIPGDTIMLSAYPSLEEKELDPTAYTQMTHLQAMITSIRNIRSEANIKPSQKIKVVMVQAKDTEKNLIHAHFSFIEWLARVEEITFADTSPQQTAKALIGQLEIHIPLAGLIDLTLEKTRLQKEIQKLEKEVEKCSAKLSNPNYLEKAPASVVEKETERLEEIHHQLAELQQHLTHIQTL